MLYELTKSAHLIALFLWIGGMIAVWIGLRSNGPTDLSWLKAYDRVVTSPAMIVALLCGIALGIQGGWFASIWLSAKIVFVLGLAGLHGALVGRLRRAAVGDPKPVGRTIPTIGLVLLAAIVLLATIKP